MNKTEYLLSMLMELPPKLADVENELKSNEYSIEEVTSSAYRFVENCFCECRDFEDEHKRKPDEEELHSSYIYEICELLLQYGLNPNLVLGKRNIMYELKYIDCGYIGAKTLRLLLENGGNPCLELDGEPLFDMIDFDVVFDVVELDNEALFDNEFKMWLLMIGYGATIKDNRCPVEVISGYSTDEFKEFENFKYEIEIFEEDWIMHIIDVRTNTEVAKL